MFSLKPKIWALFRKIRIFFKVVGKGDFLKYGSNLHLGANVRLWAPNSLEIGNNVYLGKDVHIECNAIIGNNTLIANRVAFIGKNDHDFRCIGTPVRFSPWIGMKKSSVAVVEVGEDVWIGFGAIILTGIKVGKGSIIAAGSVVTKDIPDYSIVAGVPATIISSRFDKEEIIKHEKMIATGDFQYSLKGLEYSVINPGKC